MSVGFSTQIPLSSITNAAPYPGTFDGRMVLGSKPV